VRSYFRAPHGLSLKNSHLVPRIAAIDYQILPSENAALLVEFNLIKQYRPKYNIVMRDDKSFLSIRITNEPYPRIEAVRHRTDDGSRYFGPTPAPSRCIRLSICSSVYSPTDHAG